MNCGVPSRNVPVTKAKIAMRSWMVRIVSRHSRNWFCWCWWFAVSINTTHHTPHTTHHTPQQPVLEHAMVMLGGWYDEESDPLIMMLNSWKSMPLVLVSPAYLIACRAEICFLKAKLTQDTQVARKEGLFGMCGFPDNGADSGFEFWGHDHICAPP